MNGCSMFKNQHLIRGDFQLPKHYQALHIVSVLVCFAADEIDM